MKTIIISLVLVINTLITFGQNNLEKEIKQLFQNELNNELIHNAFIKVYSNSNGINFQLSSGLLENETPFYIASIGKTFTATAISILKEKGIINFNDKISKYFSSNLLDELHVLNGVDYSKEITIAQLLQHTSGLPDYFEDTTNDGSPNIIKQLFINPNKIWTPLELIQFSKQKMDPLFVPGLSYHYTDTEYVLLGLIIEKTTGFQLHDFFKKYIFKPLKMNHTYMNLRSLPINKTKKMSEIYADEYEVSTFKSLSADWAGGGLVSTTTDLLRFYEALNSGKLIKNETFKKMQHWVQETKGMYYGFGLRKIVFNQFNPNLPSIEVIGHSGSTGSFMYFCPSLDTYIVGTLNKTNKTNLTLNLIVKVLTIIENKY